MRVGGALLGAGTLVSGAEAARAVVAGTKGGQDKKELGPALDFGVGAVAGAIGAAAVYPVDFVKTRLQAQVDPCEGGAATSLECEISEDMWERPPRQGGGLPPSSARGGGVGGGGEVPAGMGASSSAVLVAGVPAGGALGSPFSSGGPGSADTPTYSGAMDCVRQTVAAGGVGALYAGLGPQLVGVAPEKAIKLAVNASMRSALVAALHLPGEAALPLWAAVLAGGTAGFAQVVVTNPLEVVKIRLQMQDTYCDVAGCAPDEILGPVDIMRGLGLRGLYKGAGACILRDAPFSALFFPTYAALKAALPDTPLSLLLAGFLAGCPAAYLVTPADVLKTRIQLKGNAGKGVRQIAAEISATEGNAAFFKGGVQRVLRSAPQFGVTLFVFDTLTTLALAHLP